MKQNLIVLKDYDFCLDIRIFLTFYRFLDRNIFPHFLAAIAHSNPYKWKRGNKNTVKPRLTDTWLLQTVFFVPGDPWGSLGKEIPYIFSDSTRLIRDTPLVRALSMTPSVSVLAGLIVVRKHNFGWVRLTWWLLQECQYTVLSMRVQV